VDENFYPIGNGKKSIPISIPILVPTREMNLIPILISISIEDGDFFPIQSGVSNLRLIVIPTREAGFSLYLKRPEIVFLDFCNPHCFPRP